VLGKTIREQRRALAWWAFGLFAAGATYAPFYPSVRDNAATLQRYMDTLPEALRVAFVGESNDFASPAGYLSTELFAFFAPILLLLFAVGAGARAIAAEEERRTLDVLLSTPVTRRRVVLDKFGAMLLAVALLSVVLWISVPLTGPPFGLTPSLWDLAAAVAMCSLLAVAFGSLALAVACATGRRPLAIGVTAGIAAATYLIDLLAPMIGAVEWLQLLSPFHYYLGAEPMLRGLDVPGSLVLIAISAAALAVALWTFERRDLSS
jgi:ABC-2 type transport system permease protein